MDKKSLHPASMKLINAYYVLREFDRRGRYASTHYADDSGKEWNLGKIEKEKALEIFDRNQELQTEMRQIASDFLWSINEERPKDG